MKSGYLIMASLLIVSVFSQAQVKFDSPEDACEYALTHNYGNKMQQLKTEQAEKNKMAANAFLYPNITAGMTGQYNIDISETPVPGEILGQPGETVYLKFGKQYAYTAGLNVNYNLLNWTSVYQSKTAAANVQLEKANSRYYEQQLKEQVGQVYSATITAIQAEKLWNRNLLAADTIEQLTKQKFSEGLVDQLAVNQSVINRMQVVQQLECTKLYNVQVSNQLKMLLGVDSNTEMTLTEIPVQEKIEPDGLLLTPDNQSEIFKQQEKVASFEMKSALSVFAPQISLKGYFGANQYWDNFDFSFDTNDWRKSNYVGVSVTMPVFTGLANKSKYNAAKIQKQIAQTAYNEELANAELKDNNLLKEYFSAANVANTSLEKLQLSKDNLQLARQKYEQGLMSLTDYLEVFNADLSVQNQYLSDLSEFRSVEATIESRK